MALICKNKTFFVETAQDHKIILGLKMECE